MSKANSPTATMLRSGTPSLNKGSVIVLVGTVNPDDFGALPLLTNGVLVTLRDENGNLLRDLCAGVPIARNEDWSALAGTDVKSRSGMSANDSLIIHWNFDDAFNAHVDLKPRQCLQIKVQDDLSSMTLFRAVIQGLKYVE